MFTRDDIKYVPIPLPDRADMNNDEMRKAASAFYNKIRKRHSVRDFTDRAVPREIVMECIKAAGTAPSGANHQPWHFVAISDPVFKARIRNAAEIEEKKFYAGGGGDEWIKALEPIGTGISKPHLDIAPWLIVIFAQRYGEFADGTRYKNYYVQESVGIATGFLIAALHEAGLACLTHTPNPMGFLNDMLNRPASEKPVMILAVGHPGIDATVPEAAKIKKPLEQILTICEEK